MIHLNKEQVKAVNTAEGNLLIVASAGTGKTTTIVERYVNLVTKHGYKPDEVLMTTFTNKAAKDMIKKIRARTEKIPKYVGTMHSLFLRILRSHARLVLPNPNFTIIDEPDKEKIVKQTLAEERIDTKSDNVKYFSGWISRFKNRGILAEHLDSEVTSYRKNETETVMDDQVLHVNPRFRALVPRIYKKYEELLRKRNLIDLDSILLLAFQLLDEHKEIKERYSRQFRAIMVDEAQDLNVVQMKILDILQNNNLCLIGDDCQNIYEWRGSSNDLVFKFNKHFNTIILKDNYRSTENIISAVNKTIGSMSFKIEKDLKCTREKGSKVITESFGSFDDETDFVVSEVKKLLRKKTQSSEIAVLFRTNHIGRAVEREFLKNGIPCHLSKSKNFFERKEIKDVLSFLKLKANPDSRIDFERVALLLGGFGEAKIRKIEELADLHKCDIVEALDFISELNLNHEPNKRLLGLKSLLQNTRTHPIRAFIDFFKYEDLLSKICKNDPDKAEDKAENINVLIELFKGYDYTAQGMIDFLDGLIEIEKKEDGAGKVVLSTIHSAKGLEWKHVFLVCCNDGILPFYTTDLSPLSRDSELRLFYVAISRAKDYLTITHSGFNGWRELYPSEFLEIIQ